MCKETVHSYSAQMVRSGSPRGTQHRPSRPVREPARDLTGTRLDATALRVLAHPLRSRLLVRLRTGGPATATELAAVLDTNSGATSYHLRRLEAVGLVTDTGEGEGRRRVWRAVTDAPSFRPSDVEGDEDAETALGWLERDYVRHFAEQAERWLDVAPSWPLAWRDAAGPSDAMVLVTADQLRALTAELGEVIARYRRLGQGNPEAKRVGVYLHALPLDLGRRAGQGG